MGKKLEYTPRSVIRHALRQIFMRSRERQGALKRDQYTCQRCFRKQSKAKGREFSVEVHHLKQHDMDKLIDLIYELLLHTSADLITLCPECHNPESDKQRKAYLQKISAA